MMQVDLTGTRLMYADAAIHPPDEAEVFALTAAMLLEHGVAYSELSDIALELTEERLPRVAECIEYRMPVFIRDLGIGDELRQRLAELVGLRITVLGWKRGQKTGSS